MHIPYQCTNPLSEMKKSSSGFYCSDCKKHLIDTRNPNSPVPQNGDCIITDEPQEKYNLLSKTYRFAIAVFIVMGSTLILNNHATANDLIQKLDELRFRIIESDSDLIYLSGKVSDTKNRSIKPVKVSVILNEKDSIRNLYHYSSRRNSTYYFDIPKEFLNKEVVFRFEYYGEVKDVKYKVTEGMDLPHVTFKRNRKDKYSRKRYPKRPHFVGKFKF